MIIKIKKRVYILTKGVTKNEKWIFRKEITNSLKNTEIKIFKVRTIRRLQ